MVMIGLLFATALGSVCTPPGPDSRCDGGLALSDIVTAWESLWASLNKGNPDETAKLFSSTFAATLNGEPDPIAWNTPAFLKEATTKLTFDAMRILAPAAPVGKNSAVIYYEGKLRGKRSGDQIPLGPYSLKLTLTDDKKLHSMDSVGSPATAAAIASSLSQNQPTMLKAIVDKLLKAWNEQDANTIISLYSDTFVLTRNGKPDMQPHRNPELYTAHFAIGGIKYEIYNWAYSSVGTLQVQLLATYTVKSSGEKIVYYDAWLINFNSKYQIESIGSIVDTSALQAISESIPMPTNLFKKEL